MKRTALALKIGSDDAATITCERHSDIHGRVIWKDVVDGRVYLMTRERYWNDGKPYFIETYLNEEGGAR